MNLTRTALFTACLAVGLTTAAGSALAANNNANSASKGYPNGRPWLAVKADFLAVKQMLNNLSASVDGLEEDADLIHEELSLLRDDLDAVAAGMAAQSSTLQVQVSVMPDAARNADNDAAVTVFVHVTQGGVPVTGLTADAFSYTNAFPAAGASYCGMACFSAGDAGVYAITLNGDWSATTYAGAMGVSNTVTSADGDVTSNGSSLVNFDIPAAPVAP